MLRIIIVALTFCLMFQPYLNLRGEEKVIIAVASEGETVKAAVSGTAARCPYFLIVNSKGQLLEAVENPYKDARRGAGVSAANFLAEKNVTIIIAGNIGTKMRDELSAQKIAYFEFEGICEDAIRTILEKKGRI